MKSPLRNGIVVIPARNEELSVAEVVDGVGRAVDWEVVVVDDASTDSTRSEAIEAGASVLQLPFRIGAWGATQAGMAYALREGYQWCLTMDADGQHPTQSIDAVSGPVACGFVDVAIGVCPERVSSARSAALSFFKRFTGLNLQDVTSGMRAYNAAAIRLLTSREASMLHYQDIGVLLMLREAGMRATEIPVSMEARRNGHSRIYDSWWTVAGYLVETFVLSAGKWRPSWHLDDMFVSSGKYGGGR